MYIKTANKCRIWGSIITIMLILGGIPNHQAMAEMSFPEQAGPSEKEMRDAILIEDIDNSSSSCSAREQSNIPAKRYGSLYHYIQ